MESKYTPEELQSLAVKDMASAIKAYNWRVPLSQQGSTGGDNVLCGYISHDGKKDTQMYPCHRPINRFKDAAILWSAYSYRTNKSLGEKYLSWLLKESPWSGKLNVKHIPNQGLIFTDLDKTPGNLLHNFLIATRMTAEWPEFIRAWEKLSRDFPPEFAFVMVTVFTSYFEKPDTKILTNSFLDTDSCSLAVLDKYDWPLDTARADEGYVRNFLNGNPIGLSDKMYSPGAVTAPVNTLWGSVNNRSYVKDLRERYQIMSKKTGHQQTNYFGTGTVLTEILTRNEALQIIALEEKRFYEKS